MLSSVLNSEQAIEVNIAIMRAFVRLRQILETNEELNRKFKVVMRKLSTHDKYFQVVFNELKKLTGFGSKVGITLGSQSVQGAVATWSNDANQESLGNSAG